MNYMDYLIDYKAVYKMEEKEVLDMLNESLRYQCVIYLKGWTLKWSMIFNRFNVLFLSELTFLLKHTTF